MKTNLLLIIEFNKMAKVSQSENDFESFADEEPIAPLSINKYDPYQLKAGMDECIVALLEEKNFVEDNKMMDLKLVICVG